MPLLVQPKKSQFSKPKSTATSGANIDMKRVSTIILGGGQGSRLFPLTKGRCKPAMSYGGRYRLIDIPISNAINSGCQKIYILTQYLGRSLHQHILATYRNQLSTSGFLEIITAEEKAHDKVWFQGTADAIRQSMDYFLEASVDYFLVLSGDQVYNIDFREMLAFAKDTDADVVVACLPVRSEDARRMGVMKINQEFFIKSFSEKPQTVEELAKMKLSPAEMKKLGITTDSQHEFLGSMGIYLFKRKVLTDLVKEDSREDFGKHLIPTKVKEGKVAAFVHKGYWEDIGTIGSFYHANMALTKPNAPFDCYNEDWPLFSGHNLLPGASIQNSHAIISSSLLCEGSIIRADEISNSIIGPRTIIQEGSIIRNSYVMGNDSYRLHITGNSHHESWQIGENSMVDKAIIDKNVNIGDRVQLMNKKNIQHYDSEFVYIRDGIIIVPRGVSIPNDFVI